MNIIKVAEFLGRQPKPVSMAAVIEGAGVSQTTAYNCLRRLADEGLAVSLSAPGTMLRTHGLAHGVSAEDVKRALCGDSQQHVPFGQLGLQVRDVFDFAAKVGCAA